MGSTPLGGLYNILALLLLLLLIMKVIMMMMMTMMMIMCVCVCVCARVSRRCFELFEMASVDEDDRAVSTCAYSTLRRGSAPISLSLPDLRHYTTTSSSSTNPLLHLSHIETFTVPTFGNK